MKAVFNISFTQSSPPAYMKGNKRAEYIQQRNFYNLTSSYNYFSYTLNGDKVVKNANAEEYFTRGGTNDGLFDQNGALDAEKIAKLKKDLKNTKSIIWHGFISFDAETSRGFEYQENAAKFIKQTFGVLLDRTQLKKENVCLFASLHKDTDHRHIHFAFFEKEAKRRNKDGELCYTQRGKIAPEAIDNYLVSANMHLSESGHEYYTARDAAMDTLKEVRSERSRKPFSKPEVYVALSSLIEKLPKTGRLAYNSKNMESLRPEIDRAARILIGSSPEMQKAHDDVVRQLARVQSETKEIAAEGKLAYVNGKRMSREEIGELFGADKEAMLSYVDMDKIDYFSRLQDDYNGRVGNAVLGLCLEMRKNAYEDRKRRGGKGGQYVNSRGAKIAARRKRQHQGQLLRAFERCFAGVAATSQADFQKTVQELEREQKIGGERR